MDARAKIFAEIETERAYQQKRWGDRTDDTLNTPWMWTAYIAQYATKWMAGTFSPLAKPNVDDFRAKMLKTASIAIAAVESIDRQRAEDGRTFYEQG